VNYRVSGKRLQQLVLVCSIPAYMVFISSVFFWARLHITKSFFTDSPLWVWNLAVLAVEATVYLWIGSLATTLAAVVCCVFVFFSSELPSSAKRKSAIVALSAIFAVGIAFQLVPRIIPAP
jgi:hypothetical protein